MASGDEGTQVGKVSEMYLYGKCRKGANQCCILADVILYCMHPTLWLFSITILFLNWQWVTAEGQLLPEKNVI